jgi:hypothetical protein
MRTDNGGQKKSARIAIPLLDGAFNSPRDIRSRAQVFFLSIVMTETPAPLFSLRDDVLPEYLNAFKFERERGVKASDISRLAIHAVVDLLWIKRLKNSAVPNEVQTARTDHQLIYRAGTAMILWCEQFSLKARSGGGVAGSSDDSSTEDESWPVIAALQTIFFWCFHPIGYIWMGSTPPKWCPPLFVLKPSVPDGEVVLPTIQLRAKSVDQLSGAVSEIDAPGWYPTLEDAPAFRKRMRHAFGEWLNHYMAGQRKVARAAGLLPAPEKRKLALHFTWLAKYQIDKVSPERLAREYRVAKTTVEDAIDDALVLIHLEKRLPVRGGSKGMKHRKMRR